MSELKERYYVIDDNHVVFNGIRYKAIDSDGNCHECAFDNKCSSSGFMAFIGKNNVYCTKDERSDKRYVSFIKYSVESVFVDNRDEFQKEIADSILG